MATFQITTPEGDKYRITAPDGTTKAEAVKRLKKKLEADKPKASVGRMVESAVGGAADMITGDNTDELLAGAATVGGLAGDYQGTKKAIRQRMDQSAEMAPGSNIAGNLGGLVIPGVGLRSLATKGGAMASKALTGGGLVGNATRGAAAGAGYEALLAAGQDRNLTMDDIVQGAALGGAGGAVGNVASRVGARLKNGLKGADERRVSNIEKRIVDDYDYARKSGAELDPSVFSRAGAVGKQHFDEQALGLASRGKNTKRASDEFNQAAASLQNQGRNADMGTFIDTRSDVINKRLYKDGKRRDMSQTDRTGLNTQKAELDKNLASSVVNPGKFPDAAAAAQKLFTTNKMQTAVKNYKAVMAEFGKAVNRRDLMNLVNNKSLMDGMTPEAQKVLRKYANEGAVQKILSWLGYMSPLRAVNSMFSLVYNPAVGGPVLGAQMGAGALTKYQNKKMHKEFADAMFDQFEKRSRSSGGVLGGVGTVGIFGGNGE
jgi:hypothetical protein